MPAVTAVASVVRQHWYPVGGAALRELRLFSLDDSVSLDQVRALAATGSPARSIGSTLASASLWPVWAGLGRSSASFAAAVACTHLIWMAIGVLVLRRSSVGTPLRIAWVALVVAALAARGLGGFVSTETAVAGVTPWAVFVVAWWAVLAGDRRMLAVGVLAASACVAAAPVFAVPVAAVVAVGFGTLWLARSGRAMHGGDRVHPAGRRWSGGPLVAGVVGAAALVAIAAWSVAAPDAVTFPPDSTWRAERVIAPQVVGKLRAGAGYRVVGDGSATSADLCSGLALELVRAGFSLSDGHGDASTLHVVTGSAISDWSGREGATNVAAVDRRTAAERREYHDLAATVRRRLGLAASARLDPNALAADDSVPSVVRAAARRMNEIGEPVAVYLVP